MYFSTVVRRSLPAVLALSSLAFAGVNVNNGNFYIAYTDFLLPTPGITIDITRSYNSRSNYVKGYFGVGWSSEIEGYLSFEKDDIVYWEGGGGNLIRFNKAKPNSWTNNIYGAQTINKKKDEYLLQTAAGKLMSFDSKGRLHRISDLNKNHIDLVWSGDRVSMLKDNFNNQLKLAWAEFGKHQRIKLIEAGDRKARYDYSPMGDLVRANGTDGVPYEYAYDDEHNMTKIAYADGTYKEMAYNKPRDWVIKFRDRDRLVNAYDYFADSLDPESKFGTSVSRYTEGTTERENSYFWYEFRKRANGTRYNYKSVSWIRGRTSETIYTECCGTPQAITQWTNEEPGRADRVASWTTPKSDKKTTLFEYFDDGLLKKKTAPDGTLTELEYDSKFRKVAAVARAGRRVEYTYDKSGNLAWALDKEENRRLDLTYDVKGRITIVSDHVLGAPGDQKRKVFFRYNDAGKPIEIKETGNSGLQGTIKITYDPNGEVQGIYNAKGRSVASESEVATAQRIALTFQNLLEIVQPAGVSLSPEG